MLAISINIIAIVFCFLGLIIGIINDKPGLTIVMTLLLILDITLLIGNNKDYNSKNPENVATTVVHDVKGYQVDSTIVINGGDTTKTYILTYWE